jgi:hypothetical protein
MFVLIDCPADSGAAEMHTADKHKMAVSPTAKGNVCCGTGTHDQLFKLKDVTVGNAEDSPPSAMVGTVSRVR